MNLMNIAKAVGNEVASVSCATAGVVLEGVAMSAQVSGSALVAVGTQVVRGGNQVAKASGFCYEKAGFDHRPVQLLTSVDEVNKELEEAKAQFLDFVRQCAAEGC